jgi:hypothetical protein
VHDDAQCIRERLRHPVANPLRHRFPRPSEYRVGGPRLAARNRRSFAATRTRRQRRTDSGATSQSAATSLTVRSPPRATATTTAAVIAPPPPTTPAPSTADTLSRVATLSNPFPKHNETVHVYVQTSPGAQPTVTAVYKSKDTVHTGTADSTGAADVPFDIASATYGFVVDVNVIVSAAGATAKCATSFTPMST